MRYFDIILVTTNGGPADATKIIPLRLYEAAFRFFDLGYAAVIGLMMLVLTDPADPLHSHPRQLRRTLHLRERPHGPARAHP